MAKHQLQSVPLADQDGKLVCLLTKRMSLPVRSHSSCVLEACCASNSCRAMISLSSSSSQAQSNESFDETAPAYLSNAISNIVSSNYARDGRQSCRTVLRLSMSGLTACKLLNMHLPVVHLPVIKPGGQHTFNSGFAATG